MVKENMDDPEKKVLYEEMKRCNQQNYIMGCMKYFEKGDADVLIIFYYSLMNQNLIKVTMKKKSLQILCMLFWIFKK